MKLTNQLANQFNQPQTVLVISKYPVADQPASHHGVATYTRNLLTALAKQTTTRFVVLVEDTFCQEPYLDNKQILVIPAFSDGYLYPAQILQAITAFSQIKLIHIHSEFITSGKPLQMALLMPLLLGLKLLRKQVFFTAHNVIDNFEFIASHLGRSRQDWLLQLLQYLMPWYYWLLSQLVTSVVALDNSVEQRLQRVMPARKLTLSPHWVHPQAITERKRAYWRKKMEYTSDDLVIVCFGFMTKYKGVDWLVEAVEHAHLHAKGKQIKLILAGGRASSQAGKAHYEQFYQQLAERVAKSGHTVLTGFIPENEIARYFAVADLVVLPYRGILGASGSWAQALAHGKPFLLSQELAAYTQSQDVTEAVAEAGLQAEELLFTRHKRHFTTMLQQLIDQPQKLHQLAIVSQNLAQRRSEKQRIELEHAQLYTPQPRWITVQWNYVSTKIASLPAFLASR